MDLELLPKIGPKSAKTLKKLNVYSVEDLLMYYPYRYNFIKFININGADKNTISYIKVKILSEPKVQYIKRNFNRLEFIATNSSTNFKVVIFNRAFLKRNLTIDKEVVVIGKYDSLKNTMIANDIKFNISEERIEAIYHLTEGIKNSALEAMVNEALKSKIEVGDYIPEYLNKKYNFINKMDAISKIHQPKTIDDIKMSDLKLIY